MDETLLSETQRRWLAALVTVAGGVWVLHGAITDGDEAIRTELSAEITAVRSELRTEVGSVRNEIGGVRNEIDDLRSDVRDDIRDLRVGIRADMREIERLIVNGHADG